MPALCPHNANANELGGASMAALLADKERCGGERDRILIRHTRDTFAIDRLRNSLLIFSCSWFGPAHAFCHFYF